MVDGAAAAPLKVNYPETVCESKRAVLGRPLRDVSAEPWAGVGHHGMIPEHPTMGINPMATPQDQDNHLPQHVTSTENIPPRIYQ